MAQTNAFNDNLDVKNEFTDLVQPDVSEEFLDGGNTGEDNKLLNEEEENELNKLGKAGWLNANRQRVDSDPTNGEYNYKQCNILYAKRRWISSEDAQKYGEYRANNLMWKKTTNEDLQTYNRVRDEIVTARKNAEGTLK